MPDGIIQKDFVYRHARRNKVAPLIMVSGPPGSGKTMSVLRMARGYVGPEGKIYFADTDNGRALFYADEFEFEHLNLHEPFRPVIFEEAARQAQTQGAAALIIDNFMHEHIGPGGLLEFHEEINLRMARGDPQRLESTKMVAWVEPKTQHKRMRERLYQLNMPVFFACGAERKVAMEKQTEGKDKGKTIPVDRGLVPICGSDIPWAMTISLMLEDVARPGVPRPIKALLPALRPIIHLDRPLDEATGAAIAAWARGEKEPVAVPPTTGSKVSEEETQKPPPSAPPPESDQPEDEPPPAGDDEPPPPPEDEEPPSPPSTNNEEARVEDRARAIGAQFFNTADRRAHLALVDDPDLRKQIEWFRRRRKAIYDREIGPAIKASWQRTDTQKPENKQGDLIS